MTTTAIAIFVKTPALSPSKTRLAAGIGEKQALEFYLHSLKATESFVSEANAEPIWAVAEHEGLKDPIWANFDIMQSGEGDIGGRQHHVYETLLKTHDKVLLIGADSPQNTADNLNSAIAALDSHDFVIGPANDGGYYLFGGKTSLPMEAWESVPWSTEETLEAFEANLLSKPFRLTMLTDVDTEADLKFLLKEVPNYLTPAQQNLFDWVKKLKS